MSKALPNVVGRALAFNESHADLDGLLPHRSPLGPLHEFRSRTLDIGADIGEPRFVGFDMDRRVKPMDSTSYSGERYISASLAAATKAFRIT